MNKIIEIGQIDSVVSELKKRKQTIVLTGGVFDILHPGHVWFLKKAKSKADALILLLESDENVRIKKGEGRPINIQVDRANALSKLNSVDYILMLKNVTKSDDYDKLIVQFRPDLIALTKGDPGTATRRKQTELVGAKLVEIEKVATASTTDLIKNG